MHGPSLNVQSTKYQGTKTAKYKVHSYKVRFGFVCGGLLEGAFNFFLNA